MPDEDKKMVPIDTSGPDAEVDIEEVKDESVVETEAPEKETSKDCLLYTSPSPRDGLLSRMPSSA